MKDIMKVMIYIFLGLLGLAIFIEYILPLLILFFVIWVIVKIVKNKDDKNGNKSIEASPIYYQNYQTDPMYNTAPQQKQYAENTEETLKKIKESFRLLEIDYTHHEANFMTSTKIKELIKNNDPDTERFFNLLNTTRNLLYNQTPEYATNNNQEISIIELNRIQSSMNVLDNSWRTVRAKIN